LNFKDSESIERELLSLFRGNSQPRSGRIWNNNSFSCCSKEIANAFSVASFDPTEFLNDQEIFESIYDKFTKENQELKRNLAEQIEMSKNADQIDQDFEAWAKKKFKLDSEPSQGSENAQG